MSCHTILNYVKTRFTLCLSDISFYFIFYLFLFTVFNSRRHFIQFIRNRLETDIQCTSRFPSVSPEKQLHIPVTMTLAVPEWFFLSQ